MKMKLHVFKAATVSFILATCFFCPGKLNAQTITTIAGALQGGFGGDGSIAAASQLNGPYGVCIDTAGNIYIAEWQNNRIRKITKSTGNISTVAGNGMAGFSGDGGLATAAQLNSPVSVAVNKAGDIYISDLNNYRIRKVAKSTGFITTIAGTGTGTYTGDGGPAAAAGINSPYGLCLDTAENLFIAEEGNNVIRKITKATGNISTSAGNGTQGYSGDGGAATFAKLGGPHGVYVDGSNNIYIADASNHVIRKVNAATGLISTIAGSGISGYSGDGAAAVSAKMSYPTGLSLDASGNIYVVENSNNVIRKITVSNGNISTVAGTGLKWGYSGDNGPATNALLNSPDGLCIDASSDVLIADYANHRIRKLTVSDGKITTIAGFIQGGYAGDGGPAASSQLNGPYGVCLDTTGNVYFADSRNHMIRKINKLTGNISAVAGTTVSGFSGDAGLAVNAKLNTPVAVAIDKKGNIFISDLNNYRIRKIDNATGFISTIAGNGFFGYTGDGGPSVNSQVNSVYGMCVDTAGNLFIADGGNHVIRKISKSTGNIVTVAGTGSPGFSGDGSAATVAKLNNPTGVFVDEQGNIFIADGSNYAIRKVNAATGIISTVAGMGGLPGTTGDNGPATSAKISYPANVYGDQAGNLFISDLSSHVIRVVKFTDGNIYTIVGKTNVLGYNGDAGPAISALVNSPRGICIDKNSNLYIGDYDNQRIRKVDVNVLTIGINEIKNTNSSSVNLYPNPNNGNFNLDLSTLLNEKITVEIMNVLGEVLYKTELFSNGTYSIRAGNLNKGLYFARISSGKMILQKQMIIE